MENGITPVMNVGQGYNDGFGFGGGSGLWLFAILALMWGGNGFFGNRNCNQERCATVEDLNNSANFTRLENQIQGIGQGVTSGFSDLSRDLCSQSFGIVNTITGGNADIKDRLANMAAQQAQCCCDQLRGIDSVNYNAAINTAAINANTTAQTQKILDTITQNKIADMQSQINQLQLSQAVCGVVRYPNVMAYNAGNSPFCANNYGCGCNNI